MNTDFSQEITEVAEDYCSGSEDGELRIVDSENPPTAFLDYLSSIFADFPSRLCFLCYLLLVRPSFERKRQKEITEPQMDTD